MLSYILDSDTEMAKTCANIIFVDPVICEWILQNQEPENWGTVTGAEC